MLADRGARPITEIDAGEGPPLLVQPEWAERWPWLRQGVTWPGPDGTFDLGLSGTRPIGEVLGRWRALRERLGFAAAVHSRQVHGARVLHHEATSPGFLLGAAADGHVTARTGLLLAVSVADCVPVYLVDPDRHAVALLHAGWRGTAAGMMRAGVRALTAATGTRPARFHAHLGPAICGRCYEVGPEVHEALGLETPDRPTPVDLRAVLFEHALAAGIEPGSLTVSTSCTRCGPRHFFSHRNGSAGRQAAWLGMPEA